MASRAKLVLPTVGTCRWRHVRGGEAECGLVSSLTRVQGNRLSAVADEACAACCQSFPPSPRQLNPVVASLLFTAVSHILDAGGTPECGVDKAAELKRRAERSLNLVHPARFSITPARTVAPCCWLGDPLSASESEARSDARQPNGEQSFCDDEPVHVCQHPDHELTTSSSCRMCRDWTKRPQLSRFLSLDELVPPPDRRCGPTVSRWAVGVTTAPRRQSTLESCLDSIVRAGWEEPRLFLDGTTRIPLLYHHLPVTWREDLIGAWPAWYLALAELLFQQPDADAYIILQDDVVLFDRESLREYLERVLWPGEQPGFVSLFYTGLETSPGWFDAKGAWHWGAQGFVFPPGIVRALLNDVELSRAWLAAPGANHIPIPELLFEWVGRTGVDVWCTSPSLSQHIGNTSTIWMDAAIAGGRRAPWFAASVETTFATEETLADFPEDAFPCDEPDHDDYRHRVDRGRRHMREFSVVLCALCRDVRHFLPRTAARVERLGEMFRDYRVVLFENDSVDATGEFLNDWQAANRRVDVISESCGVARFARTRSLERAAWMAKCRNRYRARIVAEYANFDYVIVFDSDLPGGWSFDGVAHTFGELEWDFVGSYGLLQCLDRRQDAHPYSHFDVWAFRPARGTVARTLVNHGFLHLLRGAPLQRVESCFGGLGVYRMECIRACEYGGGDCEHVVLHDRLVRAGFHRLYLNPSQIILYSPY